MDARCECTIPTQWVVKNGVGSCIGRCGGGSPGAHPNPPHPIPKCPVSLFSSQVYKNLFVSILLRAFRGTVGANWRFFGPCTKVAIMNEIQVFDFWQLFTLSCRHGFTCNRHLVLKMENTGKLIPFWALEHTSHPPTLPVMNTHSSPTHPDGHIPPICDEVVTPWVGGGGRVVTCIPSNPVLAFDNQETWTTFRHLCYLEQHFLF